MVGLIALVATNAGGEVPALLRAIVLTAIMLAGGCLAYARVSFEWAATRIERKIEDGEVKKTDELDKLPEDMQRWPNEANWAWFAGLGAILVAAIGFLVGVWWFIGGWLGL